jgi:hypothetical protein
MLPHEDGVLRQAVARLYHRHWRRLDVARAHGGVGHRLSLGHERLVHVPGPGRPPVGRVDTPGTAVERGIVGEAPRHRGQ